MTPAEMPAGGEMDAEVARRVMGWRLTRPGELFWVLNDGKKHPRYHLHKREAWRPSTDIAYAWLVVERMAALVAGNRCNAYWWNFTAGAWTDPCLGRLCIEDPASVPLAICRAALTACPPGLP